MKGRGGLPRLTFLIIETSINKYATSDFGGEEGDTA